MVRRLQLLILIAGACGSVLIVGAARAQTSAKGHPLVTAGQKFKNIKVLKRMPADQLGKVMNIMTASLGVGCSYCHVGYDFANDRNPKKEIARRMLRMTFALNRGSFGGRPVISCNTCHNGSPEPTSRPRLDGPIESSAAPKTDASHPTAAAVLERYEGALGTPEARALIRTRHMIAERIEPDGTKEPEEIWQSLPNKLSIRTSYPPNFVIREGFDGQDAWKTSNAEPIALKADESEEIRQNALVGNQKLSQVYSRLEFGYPGVIEGNNVYVLIAEAAEGSRTELSFDVGTGLLLRRDSSTHTVLGDFVYRVDYGDYGEFDGVKIPRFIRFAMPGVRWSRKILRVENNVEVPENSFSPSTSASKRN